MRFTISILLLLLPIANLTAEEPDDLEPPTPAEQFAIRLNEFCRDHGDDLETIFKLEDKSLFLGAYWRYLNHPRNFGAIVNVDDVRLQRAQFLGALTHLAGDAPPAWWEKSLMEDHLVFDPEIREVYLKYFRKNRGVFEPRRPDEGELFLLKDGLRMVEDTDERQVFDTGSRRIPVRTEIQTEMQQYASGSSPVLDVFSATGREFLVVLDLEATCPGGLIHVDRSGHRVWSREIWCHSDGYRDHLGVQVASRRGRGPWDQGDRFHYYEILQSDDKLIFYGAGISGVYAEAFRVNDGAPAFRFSTHTSHPLYIVDPVVRDRAESPIPD